MTLMPVRFLLAATVTFFAVQHGTRANNLVIDAASSGIVSGAPRSFTCAAVDLQQADWARLQMTLTIQMTNGNSVDFTYQASRAGGWLMVGTPYTFTFDASGALSAMGRSDFTGTRISCSVAATDYYGGKLVETSYADNSAVLQDADYCYHVGSPDYTPCWIQSRPAVAQALIWESVDADGVATPLPWRRWPTALMEQMRVSIENFAYLITNTNGGEISPPVDPPPNQATLADGDPAVSVLDADSAATLYTKLVAMSLAVEKVHLVPWSVTGYGADALRLLFDSRLIMRWTKASDFQSGTGVNLPPGYMVVTPTLRDQPMVITAMPAPPLKVIRFLRAKNLIGETARDTINRVLGWSTVLYHTDTPSAVYASNTWQYRGTPPVSRMIDGSVNQNAGGAPNAHHYTIGCWGTTSFLSAVLRAVNIPVDSVTELDSSPWHLSHSLPHFINEALYISHADDIHDLTMWANYNGLPPPPAAGLLLPESVYQSWFPNHQQASPSIGRSVMEALINNPSSGWMLVAYKGDVTEGRSHANSYVLSAMPYSDFSSLYSIADLEARNLWGRIGQIIQANGGLDGYGQHIINTCLNPPDGMCNDPTSL